MSRVARRDVVHQAAADMDLAGADLLQAGDHPQGGGFTATGRADQDDEFAVGDLEVDAVDDGGALVGFDDLAHGDGCHGLLPSSFAGA